MTIGKMAEDFGCRPSDIHAGISPSLGPCCAEFINYRTEIPQSFWKYKDDAHRFNFWAITRDQLCGEGVSDRTIYSSGICTRCNPNLFFSYRGEGETGRFGAVAGLRSASGNGGDL
jgi:copper oxidase (laccase) domain-containing protein